MTTLNEIMYGGTKGQPEPEVGMGITLLFWSDREPGTIVDVVPFKSGPNKGKARLIRFQEDKVDFVDGKTVITPDPDARVETATRRKGDRFVTTGDKNILWNAPIEGVRVRIGDRGYYRDPHF